MEPAISAFAIDIIAGLIANAVTTVASEGIREGNAARQKAAALREKIKRDQTVGALIAKSLAAAGKGLSLLSGTTPVQLFLASPEAEALVRHLFVAHTEGVREADLTSTIAANFRNALHAFVGNVAEDTADSLWSAITASVDNVIERGIAAGSMAAHDMQSTVRYRILLDQLESLRHAVESLTNKQVNLAEVRAFEQQLRTAISSRHCTIVPPHFDAAVKVPIDEIFVSPRLTITPNRSATPSNVQLLDLLSGLTRLVVLGSPGGGKSTLATKLAHLLTSNHEERLAAGRLLTPLIVVLREYAADHKERKTSFLDHIESFINAKYQIRPPHGAMEYLLQAGRVLVIFDGLDELLDTSYRRTVSSNVESFCNRYGNAPVVITSREVGYEQAPLDPRFFRLCRLAPFDNYQVLEYATKWFLLDGALTAQQTTDKSAAFKRESATVADLRTNPLMLALLCNIYRGENYMPQNRPDVYEKCAVMLFEKWDASRGIHVELPFQAHIKPALMYIAYWIYGDESLQAGVSEARLVAKTTEYLWPRRFEDRDVAIAAAQSFVDFCRGRAWVFTDTGTTSDDQSLYQFTHRTFLEFFAAAHLVRAHETADDLYRELAPRIAAREWDVVAQLAFQLKSRASEGAADHLITLLLDACGDGTAATSNELSFMARSLEFLVTSPKVTRRVVTSVTERAIYSRVQQVPAQRSSRSCDVNLPIAAAKSSSDLVFAPLVRAARENRTVVFNEILRVLTAIISSGDDRVAAIAADLAFSLNWPVDNSQFADETRRSISHEVAKIADVIADTSSGRLRSLAEKWLEVAIPLYRRRMMSVEEIATSHGFGRLFLAPRGLFYADAGLPSIVAQILDSAQYVGRGRARETGAPGQLPLWAVEDLETVGQIALKTPPPWVADIELPREYDSRERGSVAWQDVSADAVFGLFCLMAVLWEKSPPWQSHWGRDNEPYALDLLPPYFVGLRRSRDEETYRSALGWALEGARFTPVQTGFMLAWAKRELDLT